MKIGVSSAAAASHVAKATSSKQQHSVWRRHGNHGGGVAIIMADVMYGVTRSEAGCGENQRKRMAAISA